MHNYSFKRLASAFVVLLLVFMALDFKTTTAEAFTSYNVKVTAGSLNIRGSASISSKIVGSYSKGTIVEVIGESGQWLKTSKGYISSAYTQKCFTSYKVKVTTALLNIRSTASTSGRIVGGYTKGTIVEVIGESGQWLKTSKGYILSTYTERYAASTPTPTATPDSGTSFDSYKVRIIADVLNIRSTPSTSGKKVGTYSKGTIVEVIGKSGEWLKTSKGYISSFYTEIYTSSYKVKITTALLNIRSAASTSSRIVGSYTKGAIVEVIGRSGEWLKTEKGYIYATYTEKYMESTPTPSPTAIPTPTATPTPTPTVTPTPTPSVDTSFEKYKVMVTTEVLNIRSIPSTSGQKVGAYSKGTIVEVVGESNDWLKTDKGYISAFYVERCFTPYKVKVTTALLNIRNTASTSGKIVGGYTKGTIVEVIGELGEWLQTSLGYIYSTYTEVYKENENDNSEAGFKAYKAVITAETVNIRSTPDEAGSVVGTYTKGTVVEIIGQSGDWLQTYKGYIHKDYAQKKTGNGKYISINKNYAVLTSIGGQADERHVVAGEKFEVLGEEAGHYRIKVGSLEGYIPCDIATVLETAPSNKLTMAWNYIYAKASNKVYYDSDSDYIRRSSAQVGMDIISPTWFNMTGTYTDLSSIKVQDIADTTYVATAHKNGYEVWATFTETNANRAYAMFTNSTVRQRVIDQVVSLALKYNVDGINIDFEALGMKNKDLFTQFVKDLSGVLRKHNLTVSVDVIKPSSSETWSKWYDRGALSKYADYIMYMAYDENTNSAVYPGSVASKPWVESGIVDILDEGVPPEKLVMCVPFYIRDYTVDSAGKVTSSSALMMQAASDRVKTYGGTTYYDSRACQTVATYTMSGKVHKVWMENASSMAWRMDLINKYDLAGAGAWQLYLETADIWDVIKDKLK